MDFDCRFEIEDEEFDVGEYAPVPEERSINGLFRNFDQSEGLFSGKELAELFSVSVKTIQRIRDKGEIPHYKIGNLVRYFIGDIREYRSRCRVPAMREEGGEVCPHCGR